MPHHATRSTWRRKTPRELSHWPHQLLDRWRIEGTLTLRALSRIAPAERSAYIDHVGAGLPRVELPVLPVPGLLGAAERGDGATFARVSRAIFEDGWTLVNLGAPECIWRCVNEEGARLWKRMRAGRTSGSDGRLIEGVSPSGAPRGDRFIPLSVAAAAAPGTAAPGGLPAGLPGGALGGADCSGEAAPPAGSCPALQALDTALAIVGTHLSSALAEVTGRRLHARTDPNLACFPADGPGYGAHFDGGGASGRLTMILYTNEAWAPADGGTLELYDEARRVWRTVAPAADRLLLFRSDDVLHRVAPPRGRPRYALSAWWLFAPTAEREPLTPDEQHDLISTSSRSSRPHLDGHDLILLRAAYPPDDPRRRQRFRAVPGAAGALLRRLPFVRPAREIEQLIEDILEDG